jgi:hypothetical protein
MWFVTGEGLVHVNCPGFINCRYTGAGLESTGKGALLSSQEYGETMLSGQGAHKESGALCPEKSS